MKKFQKLVALVLALVTISTVFVFPTYASDGGEGKLTITAPSDNGEVNGNEDVKIKWTKVLNAHHYHLTIKDTVTGEKPFDEHVYGTSKTIKANTVFLVEGRTYKVYACAMDINNAVLNRGSDWESIYVTVASNAPKLVYASPALTSPAVDVKYDAKAYCYYGIYDYDGGVDSSKNLTVKWEDVYADYYSFTAVILKGEPDLGSTSEKKLHEIVIQKKRTSCKYTIDKDDLEGYEGKYLKVVVQPMSQDGDFGLMSMFYLKIADTKIAEQDTPPVTDDTNQDSENVTFFLQDQSPWGNHPYGHKDEDCIQATNLAYSGCGILSMTNAIYQLNGCFIDPTLIADYAMNNGHRVCGVGTSYSLYPNFAKRYGDQYGFTYGTRYTEVDFSVMRKELENGAVIIANTPGHFFVIAQYDRDTDTYLVLDSLPSKSRGTTENGDWKTTSELSNGSLKIRYYMTFLKVSDASDIDSPVVVKPVVSGGSLELSIPATTATPGSTVEIPIMVTKNPGFAFIQLSINSDLDYTIENTTSDLSMVEGKSTIFYGNSNRVGSFTLATLKIRIPDTAANEKTYDISVNVSGCYNLDEQQLSCDGASSTISVLAVMMGDITSDDKIDGLDVIRLAKHLCGAEVSINETESDISKDGKINGIDLILLLKLLLA